MITDIFISIAFNIMKFVMNLFPSVPQLPTSIHDGIVYFFDKVNEVNGVMIYLVSEPLYVAAIGLILFVMLYDLAVKVLIMMVFKFVLKKVVG